MAAFGAFVLGQGAWVYGSTEQARHEHEAKLKEIQEWQDAFVATAPRASQALEKLGNIDKAVLGWLNKDFDNTNGEVERFATEWNQLKLKRCLEVVPFIPNQQVAATLLRLLYKKTGIAIEQGTDALYHSLWREQETVKLDDPSYADFKAVLYRGIDPRFSEYFGHDKESSINLSEVRWGGVERDGIPPLRQPKMIKAGAADYLNDSDIIFGLEIKGDARAYPKRILAWHEMITDEIGGRPIAGVYCTLCGTMIPYDCEVDGKTYLMGTSGFLYRSNKLMYDKQTKSLWSTASGEPVIGALVGRKIKLGSCPVVTTTWKQWKQLHPDTSVLSLDTGYSRDYGEGVAYKNYFATDELMFTVQAFDSTLPNKAEVLVLPWATHNTAISTTLLKSHPIYQAKVDHKPILILTDKTGANRVYRTEVWFTNLVTDTVLLDKSGRKWNVEEAYIQCQSTKERASRLPAHRAFWFGWHAAYPKGLLISNFIP
ncbi:hypothetical protein BH11CYA1_BH11CYA1_33050 [soil metagenome]